MSLAIMLSLSALCLVAGAVVILVVMSISRSPDEPAPRETRDSGSPRAQAHAFGRMLARDHKAYAYDLADAVSEGIRHELYGDPADRT